MIHTFGKHKAFVAVISHGRPENVKKLEEVIDMNATWFVDDGEQRRYSPYASTYACGYNICDARNKALQLAGDLPCIQVSDDLRKLSLISIENGKHKIVPIDFKDVVKTLIIELLVKKYNYGGVAVSSNRLNYTGKDFSYNLLLVNDLICVMPGKGLRFDIPLKEDYDMTIRQLIGTGGVVRCNQFLCDFPHRENKGGANEYRNTKTELEATRMLKTKWGPMIKDHARRPGQVSLNYPAIRAARQEFLNQRKKV